MSIRTTNADPSGVSLQLRPRSTDRFDVAVVGLGYVGLPTALSLSAVDQSVAGIDISERRLDEIRKQRADLVPADRIRLASALTRSDFVVTADTGVMRNADAVLICVPTPVDDHRSPDLGPLESACRTVVQHARRGQVIILTSTTYIGCTREMLLKPLEERGFLIGEDIYVAFSPERIDPGNIGYAQDAVPRVVGGATAECTDRALRVIGRIAPVHAVSTMEAAEFTKLYENIFRAVNIALANELADVGQSFGVDVMEVIGAAATKPYGFMPFYPGPGVGGHCIPCDPHYLLWQLRAKRMSAPLIRQAMDDIELRPVHVVSRAVEVISGRVDDSRPPRVLVVGVAYKPGVEDVRESPALPIMEGMRERGWDVAFTDRFVESVELHGGRQYALGEFDPHDFDLVVALVLHPDTDHSWIAKSRRVLDATYRLEAAPNTFQV
jgi:UDP-N-acetyl-D-glucosamine dehydrogenase